MTPRVGEEVDLPPAVRAVRACLYMRYWLVVVGVAAVLSFRSPARGTRVFVWAVLVSSSNVAPVARRG
jgi:hypothetical protein